MVTNLPPEAKAKFAKYQEARTPEEKLQALQEFLSAVPKHKGTENLVRWIRRRMAELREEIEESKRKSSMRGGGLSFFVSKEGDAQVVILGFTKSGKSLFLKKLTNVKIEVSDTPYTTTYPVSGMFIYRDIYFQLIETPSLTPDPESKINRRSIGLARNADALIILTDLSNDPVSQYREIVKLLDNEGIKITRPRGRIEIIKAPDIGGLRVVSHGRIIGGTLDDVRKIAEGYRIYRAEIRIYGELSLEDIEDQILGLYTYKPAIVIGNKKDLVKTDISCTELRNTIPEEIPVLCVSSLSGGFEEELGSSLVKILDLIRVYTKPPNGEVSKKPLVIKRGTTVLEIAKMLHEDIYRGFQFARIWGSSVKYPGARVGGQHVVEDGDIIEIHYKIIRRE